MKQEKKYLVISLKISTFVVDERDICNNNV